MQSHSKGKTTINYLPPGYLSAHRLLRERALLQQYRENSEHGDRLPIFFCPAGNDPKPPEFASKGEVQPAARGEIRFLHVRIGLIEAELNFRRHNHSGGLPQRDLKSPGAALPRDFSTRCYQELTAFRRQEDRSSDVESDRRIPLPDHPQQLWAHHKYSIMARDPNAYDAYGPYFAQVRPSSDGFQLVGELGSFLYEPPPSGRLRNALQHMWGYVNDESTTTTDRDPLSLLCHIQQLAAEQEEQYILHSTALTELAFWSNSAP